jgi:ABC-type uncharacterized transport system permease subunit
VNVGHVVVEFLFWPALLAYGEAAVAYAGNVRYPWLSRLAIWGVRAGWSVQTALLVVQAYRAGGFPWDTWAGSLNLFVWLVVGGYLVWGCKPRYRLLGLAVMPFAAVLLGASYLGGGADANGSDHFSTAFLVLHVGLVLAAFAGLTLAAALGGLYLWEERALKLRRPGLLRLRAPSLLTLEQLGWRTVVVALPLLTLGMLAGFVHGASLDPQIVVTLVAWALYAAFLVTRPRGRRAAQLQLAGFALVLTAPLGLLLTHLS